MIKQNRLPMKRLLTLFLASFAATLTVNSQAWVEKMLDPNVSFYDVQQEFNNYWAGRPYEKGKGYKQFKRWEAFMEPRVYPSGDKTLASQAYEKFVEYQQNTWSQHGGTPPIVMSSTWTPIGPMGAPTNGNAGRLNFVRFHPTNTNIIYVGAPDGGLWTSTNGGTSWTTNTDQLAVIGCTDIAIDPTNTNTMYLATGDGDAGDSYSVGVLKSTDGGLTWNTTGLSWTVNLGRTISKLLIDPTAPSTLLAATSNGVYRTTNGGATWTQTSTYAVKDIEFKPGATATVYASGTRFLKSTNNGAAFTVIATGLPANTAVDRLSIAVTAANSAYVYVLAGNSSDNGFNGVFRSTNDGASFTTMATTPNLMGWSNAGSDAGGQSWYDHGFAVSPTNANEVLVGGVNVWRSTNGGTSYSLYGHWTGSGAPYIHADIHCIEYNSAGVIYVCSDGGIFRRSGTTWTDLSVGMNIAQPYRIGLSASNASLIIAGHQDNGTNRYNGSWSEVMGGDGMDCFIDRTNNNVMYGEQYNGSLNRSTNGGTNWSAITSGLSGSGAWMTPWHQDPSVANTIYVGYQQMFKSTNQGTAWTQIGTMTGTSTIVEFAVAPSNNQVIYCIKGNVLYKTINGGTAWTNVTGTLPTASAQMKYIAIDPTDPNNAWVTFSGYSSANKIFETANGGTSWTNISTGLPNLPCNVVCYTPGSTTDAIYVGMDVGVYYRDNTTGTWNPYYTGLPNVNVSDLEIYVPTGKLRAATFGRGVWEVDLYNPGTLAPLADFTSNRTVICPGNTINFTDLSSFNPTTWSWSVSPSTGVTINTATSQNPSITFANAGTYTVTLVATNANGSDSEIKNAYVTVSGTQALPLSEGFVSATFPPTNWTSNNINGDAIFWTRTTTAGGQGSAESMIFDNYNLDAAGARDEIQTPKYSFSGLTSATLTFDVAYRPYDNVTYTDSLAVLVSTDCGQTFTQVYMKGGATLATVAGTQTATIFVPSGTTQWRNETVSLNAYAGQTNVMVAFQNRGHWGQAIYVDNINISGVGGAAPVANFTSASTKCTGTAIAFTDATTNSPSSWAWSCAPSAGVTVTTATTQNPTMTFASGGTYTVSLTATNAFGSNTTSQTIVVTATPTVAVASQTVCAGNSTTLSAAGATAYSWNTGATTASISVTPTVTTTYTVTGTTSGCSGTSSPVVTVNALPNVTVTSPTICAGTSATVTGSGGTSYSWNTGATTASITVTPTVTTQYTVTGTGANGCTKAMTSTVTVNALPNVVSTNASSCAGASATITASGGTTYSWNTGATTASITVTPTVTTTYTVTGTGANGCTKAATATVTVAPNPTVTATSQTVCAGSSATLTASGATSYSWSTGATTATISVTPTVTTTYTVTGTTSGCNGTNSPVVTVNALPNVTVTSPTICAGASAIVTGSGGTSYSWNTGATTASITVTPTVTTQYTVTGTGANGCTKAMTSTVTVNALPNVVSTNASSCAGASATITASGGTTYSWNTGAATASITVTPTVTTTYTVTGTGANGCTKAATATVTVAPNPTVTATSQTVCAGSSATLTASGATSYSWSTGATTATISVTPTVTTTYTVTGTTSGCNGTNSPVVTVNALPNVTVTSPSVCAGASATVTGSGGTSYSWNTGATTASITVTPTVTTQYTVTGTGANGCTKAMTSTVTVTANPTVTVSSQTVCAGTSATLSAGGATTYSWNTGATTASITITPTVTTTYSVTGTTNGCNGTNAATVTVDALPNTTTSNQSMCDGSSATLTAAGASTYSWSTGATTSSITVSPTTTTAYTVTGTAANGCTSTSNATVTVNPLPVVTVTSQTVCTGNSATLSASGGSAYSWNTGAATSAITVTPSSTTIYTVTGTDANLCSASATSTVTVVGQPSVTVNGATICAGDNAVLTASGASTYGWSEGSTGTSITVAPSTTTTYTVTGTAGAGCSNTATSTVNVNSLPLVTATSDVAGDSICSGESVTLNGSGAISYVWTGGVNDGLSFSPVSTQTYSVTGTDANNCSNNATITVTVNACLGMEEANSGFVVNVYPNPVKALLNISISNMPGKKILELFDNQGKLVDRMNVSSDNLQIPVSHLAEGNYVIRLYNESGQVLRKIMIEK
jgi:PKD repeat protein